MASVIDRIRRTKEEATARAGMGTPQGYAKRGSAPMQEETPVAKARPTAKVSEEETPAAKTKKLGFGQAFASARKSGAKEFEWEGKKYHTRTRDEEMLAAKKAAKAKEGAVAAKPHTGVPLRSAGNPAPKKKEQGSKK